MKFSPFAWLASMAEAAINAGVARACANLTPEGEPPPTLEQIGQRAVLALPPAAETDTSAGKKKAGQKAS